MADARYTQRKIWDVLRKDGDLPPGLEEVREFLVLSEECDGELVRALELERGHGRDDYPVRAMWRLMAVSLYLRKGRFSDLLGELRRSRDLARLLGFQEPLPNHFEIPSNYVVSRFHKKLKEERYRLLLKQIHVKTVELVRREDPAIGEHAAGDATDVRTHGHAARREGEKETRPSTDPEASWSVKTKRWEDGAGRKREETQSTFGYKAYLTVDVLQPVVLTEETKTGKTSDQTMAEPMLEATVRNVGEGVLKSLSMDKGFDSTDTVKAGNARGVAMLIPVREVAKDLQGQSAADREKALKPGGNIVWDSYSGKVACYAKSKNDEVIRREMKHAGFEQDRQCHKFRCPLGGLAAGSCSVFATCSAGNNGKLGKQVRVPMETDWRRFASVYPQSKKWERMYNGRTAVERVNSYLKEILRLEAHALRGKAAIELRVTLASVTLNLRTLMVLREAKSRAKGAA